jgi:hypothetical protein
MNGRFEPDLRPFRRGGCVQRALGATAIAHHAETLRARAMLETKK